MTQLQAISLILDACCVKEKEKLEAVGYVVADIDPQRVADAIKHLSEWEMESCDMFYTTHGAGKTA